MAPRKQIYSNANYKLLIKCMEANIIVPAGMNILCIALRYNKPKSLKITKHTIYYFHLIKLESRFYSQGFNIYYQNN